MRSGSTFAGKMFDFNPDAFYIYEPLHYLNIAYRNNMDVTSISLQTRKVINYNSEAITIIKNYLTCNLHDLPIETLIQGHQRQSESSSLYLKCMKTAFRDPASFSEDINPCMGYLKDVCLRAKFTAVKTINFPMEAAREMITNGLNIKIIHLIRDPRAVIKSQVERIFGNWSMVQSIARHHCARLQSDFDDTKTLLKSRPQNIKVLFYEDLVADMFSNIKYVYDFIEVQYRDSLHEFVQALTTGNETDGCMTCAVRPNTEYESVKWRTKIDYKHVLIIDNECWKAYDKLGYVRVRSRDHLLNLNVSLRRDVHI
ncbi:carbohydrate sulfotransferase 1-like [Haliotis rubra]|uniref:carbohydrate sulfotransferase 1-like n=1 Tax=Haliotis rubra TaxID=36100 RepID=UPI001EE4F2CB|nr:carbohydrate sulfotransferase 1-like [Haliotis rubra]